MRVLIAGATGAIGRPLIRCLNQNLHTVYALARSPKSSRVVAELGAGPVTADALDAASVKAAITQVRPDAVINELTSLPSHYTAAEMRAAAEPDREVRIKGNVNLLAALRDAGVRRYVLQSGGFWYAPGDGLADESVPFAFEASPAVAAGARRYAELEATATGTPGIEFVALRYGFFYGPGTWYRRDGDMGEQAREQRVPVIGGGQGVWSWVHIENAVPARIMSSTQTRHRNASGSPPSHARSARRRRLRSPKKRRWRRLAPIRSIMRRGCAGPRTRKRNARSIFSRARSNGCTKTTRCSDPSTVAGRSLARALRS
jgi:2-alkyl-3-oxoalkanoate reductase